MNAIQIHQAENADLDTIFTHINGEKILTPKTKNQVTMLLKDGQIYAAYDGQKAIGAIIKKTLYDGAYELQSLWVDEAYRHKGIARQLLQYVCQDASQKGIASVANKHLYQTFYTLGFCEPNIRIKDWRLWYCYISSKSIETILTFLFRKKGKVFIRT